MTLWPGRTIRSMDWVKNASMNSTERSVVLTGTLCLVPRLFLDCGVAFLPASLTNFMVWTMMHS
jgi:hypothetical protein